MDVYSTIGEFITQWIFGGFVGALVLYLVIVPLSVLKWFRFGAK